MRKSKTKELCLAAVMAALVVVVTMCLQIPVPAVGGYVHPGDGIIFLAVIILGTKYGIWAGAMGACLADILTGYAVWAPFSFIIKGVMAAVCGKIVEGDKSSSFVTPVKIFGILAAVFLSAAGYYPVGAMFVGSFSAALLSIPSDLLQGGIGLAVYLALVSAFSAGQKALGIKKP